MTLRLAGIQQGRELAPAVGDSFDVCMLQTPALHIAQAISSSFES